MSTLALQALTTLHKHMERHRPELLKAGTFASDEFDRLYLEWIRIRWDDNDPWVRKVWIKRP